MSGWIVKTIEELRNQDIPGVVVDEDGQEVDYINGNMTIVYEGRRYPVIRFMDGELNEQINEIIDCIVRKGKQCAATVRFACREGPAGEIQELVYEGPGRMVRMVGPNMDDKLLPVRPESLEEAINCFQNEEIKK